MPKTLCLVCALAFTSNLIWPTYLNSQTPAPQKPETRESSSTSSILSIFSGDQPAYSARISQYQKLVDDKNYELSTSLRVPSINGGERVDREINEKSHKVNENQFKVERVVRTPDSNGRLSLFEIMEEDHQRKDKTEEIQRNFSRPDINGRIVPQQVEKETITTVSEREKRTTRALYRPDAEGKFSLVELDEGSENKISASKSVKESTRKVKDANGRFALAGNVRETTTKLNEKSYKKESVLQQLDENGRLVLTDKTVEMQRENPDGTRVYEKILESRNINPQIRNPNGTGLILSQRITGEERKLADGTIENTIRVETLDPMNLSNGLRVSGIITEISKPAGNGKITVERVIKTRDVNGNYVVSQRTSQTLASGK